MKKALLFFGFFTFITLVGIPKASATDLTIDTIYSPLGEIVPSQPVDIRFRLRNINRLLADTYTVQVTIQNAGGTTVYDRTITGANLPAYTDTVYTLPKEWTPTTPGSYRIVATVNYSQDIDHSNDQHTGTFLVLTPPNISVGVSQVVRFAPTGDTLTDWGIVRMSVPPTQTVKFLNIAFQSVDSTNRDVWLVRNIMVLPSDRTDELPLSTWIDFHRLGIPRGTYVDSIRYCVSVTDSPLTQPPIWSFCQWYHLTRTDYLVGPGATIDSLIVTSPAVLDSTDLPAFTPHTPVVTDSVERGCTLPNVNLDSSRYNPQTDTSYAGDWNACGPAAAANSMEWLDEADPRIATNTTLREKVKELSRLMDRGKREGVTTEQLIQGKLRFIDKYKLPIRVKYQSLYDTSTIVSAAGSGHSATNRTGKGPRSNKWAPVWSWIVQEMKDSEDVEMMVGWFTWDYDPSTGSSHYVRHGGHWFALTGTHTILGVHRFSMKDDGKQADTSGVERTILTYDTTSDGYPIIPEWCAYHNKMCVIESVVSESVDTTILFPSTAVPQDQDHALQLTAEKTGEGRLQIRYSVIQEGSYSLKLYDVLGKEVASLFEDRVLSGPGMIAWSATLPSGAYFLILDGQGGRRSVRIVLP